MKEFLQKKPEKIVYELTMQSERWVLSQLILPPVI